MFEQRGDCACRADRGCRARSVGVAAARQWGGGIAVDEFEDPAGGDVLDEQGEFGEGQGEQVVELVDETGALADDGLEAAGDLAEGAEFG